MKRNLLLMMMSAPIILAAQSNGVTVSNLAVSAGTVTFNVSWDKNDPDMPSVWSDSVWVFVDYNNGSEMTRLPLLPGATLTETSAPGIGKVVEETGNTKGVWVVGNAKTAGSFSATVQLPTSAGNFSGACVYASNYPPVGVYSSPTNISFTGTPNYEVVLTHTLSGATSTETAGKDYVLFPGYVITSFTDATGAPGTFHCLPPVVEKGTFCFGLPGQLQAAASGNETIAWYDAPTAGNLLYAGNVLPLTPLYNNAAQYYAQAVSENNNNCVSTRTAAYYTVNNCTITGDCPGFTAGSLGTITTPAACSTFYPGQIGTTNYPVACVSFDAGRIGKQN
jgi:hypothetical protein